MNITQEDVNITLTVPAHDSHIPVNVTKTQVFLRAPPLCRSTMSRQACCSTVGGGMLNSTEKMHNVTALSMAQDGITFISKGGLRMNREYVDEGNEGSYTRQWAGMHAYLDQIALAGQSIAATCTRTYCIPSLQISGAH